MCACLYPLFSTAVLNGYTKRNRASVMLGSEGLVSESLV
ncbi:hypothetical protein HPTD01_1223 [Halomonas sp. TD01]|nr:hypothetical protein HPTD01_1223 [Halomonas sp. TD01]